MVVWVRFTVFWIHGGLGAWGARNSVPPWTGTPTLAALRFGEPKSLRSFVKLLKHPTSKDNEGYTDQKLWGVVPSKQDNAPNAEYLSYSLLSTGSLLGICPAPLGLWSFKATGCAFCADYGFLTFMEVPSVRGAAPLAPRPISP